MPIYEYKCNKCKSIHEVIQLGLKEQERLCPNCKEIMEKIMSAGSFEFKGSGFYANDYKWKKNG